METIFPVIPSDAKQNLLLGESTLDSTEKVFCHERAPGPCHKGL